MGERKLLAPRGGDVCEVRRLIRRLVKEQAFLGRDELLDSYDAHFFSGQEVTHHAVQGRVGGRDILKGQETCAVG